MIEVDQAYERGASDGRRCAIEEVDNAMNEVLREWGYLDVFWLKKCIRERMKAYNKR